MRGCTFILNGVSTHTGNDLDLVSDIRVDPDLFLFPDRLESQQTFRQLPAEIETLTVSSDLLVLQPLGLGAARLIVMLLLITCVQFFTQDKRTFYS